MKVKCIWKYDETYNYYESECGSSFIFSYDKRDKEFVYCPYCGKKIEETSCI